MVEGHQCHRVAAAHRKLLVGRAFKATSPNARFEAGAAAINNKPLAKVEVHGKNIFYFFRRTAALQPGFNSAVDASAAGTDASGHEIVHVHFGMAGAFKTFRRPGDAPTPTTRLRLESDELDLVAHLSAMVVKHGDDAYYAQRVQELGPDPLREDCDVERLWAKVQASKKPIGLVLMDQAMVAGLGNIYRAEVLFKARLHPEQPANTVTRAEFDALWRHCTHAMQRGFVTGSILTVDAVDAAALGPPWTRRYVYNHKRCGVCGGAIQSWDMANRTVYACTRCQPLRKGTEVPAARQKAMAAAAEAQEFVSHCASDAGATLTPAKMTVAQLSEKLREAGIQKLPKGKPALVALLTTHLQGVHEAPEDTLGADAAGAATDDHAAALVVTGAPVDAAEEGMVATAEGQGAPKRSARRAPAAAATDAAVAAASNSTAQEPGKLKVPELKAQLRQLGVRYPSGAKKAELVDLLAWAGSMAGGSGGDTAGAAAEAEAEVEAGPSSTGGVANAAAVSPEVYDWDASAANGAAAGATAVAAHESAASHAARCAAGEYGPSEPVVPGIRQFEAVATAGEAALEKQAAGENRAVEHVALAENADGLVGLGRLASDAEDDYADVPAPGEDAEGGEADANARKRSAAQAGASKRKRAPARGAGNAAGSGAPRKSARQDTAGAEATAAAEQGSKAVQSPAKRKHVASKSAENKNAADPAASAKSVASSQAGKPGRKGKGAQEVPATGFGLSGEPAAAKRGRGAAGGAVPASEIVGARFSSRKRRA